MSPSCHTTIEATVSLPWKVEMSKQSMRRGSLPATSFNSRNDASRLPPYVLGNTSHATAAVKRIFESSGAQLAYIDVPNGCGNVLKALKSVGYTGKIMGIDPCGAPPVIEASAGGANGMYIAAWKHR